MKKGLLALCFMACSALSVTSFAQNKVSDAQRRINAAVMAVYNEELAKNPYD